MPFSVFKQVQYARKGPAMRQKSFRYLLYFFLCTTLVLCSPAFACGGTAPTAEHWKSIAPGAQYGLIQTEAPSAAGGEIAIHIVRVDPCRVKLKLLLAADHDRKLRTAGEWCRDFKLIAAVNAGMFLTDYSTNVGYLRNGLRVQNGHWHKKYKSALAFEPRRAGIPPAIMLDLDEPEAQKKLEDYQTVVQNLRLLKGNGVNVWERSEKRWSEAAVGIDREGRLLFIFCPSPLSMWSFNEKLGSLNLGLLRMMHMEGGAWASFSVRTGDFAIDLAGVNEMMLPSDMSGGRQMQIPNIIGIQAR
jgi:hypothetical protein